MIDIFRKKDANLILKSNTSNKSPKHLSALDVSLMSIGATIGTGVMVLTGLVAARDAGPAVIISFTLAALVCILVALCYAEFASTIPTSGSSYSYVYVSLGEFWAYLVGWSLILGYTVSVATVAGGWSAYTIGLLNSIGIHIPIYLTKIPSQGGLINIPGILVILFITFILSLGTKESKKFNNFLVFVKLGVIALFIIVGSFFIKTENYTPFMPYGIKGVFAGAASVFFAYSGFDAVSTCAEEVKNPQKNLPIGIISSIIVCVLIYVFVCLVLTGSAPYTKLNVPDSMAFALYSVNQAWAATIISIGSILGLMAGVFAYAYGASRLLMSMSRDGLLSKSFSKLNKKTDGPTFSIWIIGICGCVLSGFVDLKQLADLANMAFISTFFLVSFCILRFRQLYPNMKRNFKVPMVPYLPILSMLSCLFLLANLSYQTIFYFGMWSFIGLVIYFSYSFKHSTFNNDKNKAA